MEKVKVHIHSKPFSAKPKNVGAINSELTKTVSEVTAKELAQLVGKEGRTSVLGVMNGKRAKANLVNQQVLMLDFDNEEKGYQTTGIFYQTIAETLEDDFIKENASFIYKTFSHTASWERFRVAFILDKPLNSNEEVFSAYRFLMEKFPNSDKAPKDSSRIFFGGTEVIEIDYSNQLSVKDLPEVKVVEEEANTDIVEYTEDEVIDYGVWNYETPTWMLIKAGHKEEVKRRWAQYGYDRNFRKRTEAWRFVRTLDMGKLLGIEQGNFKDILEYEENPSASIHKGSKDGTYLYTQHNKVTRTGRTQVHDIFSVVRQLTGLPIMGAEQYMYDTLDISFNVSKEYEQLHREVDMFKAILISPTFKEEHPEMYQMYGRYGYHRKIHLLLEILMGNLYEKDNGEIEMITFMSIDTIAEQIGMSKSSTHRLLNMLTLTKVLDKLPEEQIPHNLLKLLKKNQTHVKNGRGEWVKRGAKRQYLADVRVINPMMTNFDEIEGANIREVENGFTMKGLSREYVLRTSGEAEADRVFPQDEGRTISKKSDEITMVIRKAIMSNIQDKGYAIINEVKEDLRAEYKSLNYTDYKYKQQEAEMIEAYGLEKRSLTNDMKEEYDITHLPSNARPQVLILA